ncbi:MAG: glycerophosphodiester phosphodiesterase family protein, partial [Flavisolibacter sp.]
LIDSVENYCSLHQLPLPYYNIETKTQPLTDGIYHPGPKEFVDLLIHLIQSKGVEKRVIIQSFDFRTLQYLHQQYPFFPTAMLVEADDKRSFKEQFRDLGFTPTIYSPEFSLVNEAMVSQCHRQKMKLIPWTVDDLEKMKELKQMGVDGIISDYPNLFRELR